MNAPRPRRCSRIVALLAVALLAGGCSNVVVYDEHRDKQGQEAKKQAAEARIGDTVKALETSFAQVAAMEEARARDRAEYLFDLELSLASRAPTLTSKFAADAPRGDARQTNGLQTVVETRLSELGLRDGSLEGLQKLRESAARVAPRQRALETTLIEFAGAVGHRFDDCEGVAAASSDPGTRKPNLSDAFANSLPADKQDLARLKYPGLVEDCQRLDDVLGKRGEWFDQKGLVAQGYRALDRLHAAQFRHEQQMSAARDELRRRKAALQQPQADATAAPSTLESVQSRAQRLAELVRVLADGSGTFGDGGKQALAAERLARLEALLGAIAGTPTQGDVKLTTDEKVSVAVIRDLPALADEANKLLTDARRPRLTPFVAAIDQQRLVLQGFEAGQRAKRTQEAALRSALEAMLSETNSLARMLAAFTSNPDWSGRSIAQLLAGLQPDKSVEFLRTLATYGDEVRLHRTDGAVWKVRAQAAQYEEGLVRSVSAAAQWDALTDTIATVLADYHAAGIKKADLAEFFKALGLVVIGVGAAQ